MPSRVVSNAREAIDVLGGVVHVAKLCGVGRNAVSNWYRRGFPPERHAMLGGLLEKAGYRFEPRLFKQYELGGKK